MIFNDPADMVEQFANPDHKKALNHALKHVAQHNTFMIKFMVHDLALRMDGLELMANVFEQRGKGFRKASVKLTRQTFPREWFFVWNCYNMARQFRGTAVGIDADLQQRGLTVAYVREMHDRNIDLIRAKRAAKGRWTWPHPTTNKEAHALLLQRYPMLMTGPQDMVDLRAEGCCPLARFEQKAPAGPLPAHLIHQLRRDVEAEMDSVKLLVLKAKRRPTRKDSPAGPMFGAHHWN